jgi:membrane-bound serine protease (ClpP class)
VLLIIFAIVLFIAEIKIVSHGMLTVAGVISLVLGSIMLFESPIPALRVSLDVMIPTVVIVSLFFVWVIAIAVKAQIGRPVTGQEGMTGEEGYAITAVHTEGKVFVRGEYWNASSRKPVEKGKRIKVIGVKGLKVNVEEVEKEKEE